MATKKAVAAKSQTKAKAQAKKTKSAQKPIPPLHINHQAWDKAAVMAIVCAQIAVREVGIRTILAFGHEGHKLPNADTIMVWLAEDKELAEQYARAREAQADLMAERTIQIADEEVTTVRGSKHPGAQADEEGNVEVVFDSAAVARNRLRVDARKWLASKLAPKKYGERTTLAGDAENPLAVLTMEQITNNPASRIKIGK